MYLDSRLVELNKVDTLSRLNRDCILQQVCVVRLRRIHGTSELGPRVSGNMTGSQVFLALQVSGHYPTATVLGD